MSTLDKIHSDNNPKQGFHPSAGNSQPLTDKGHQPGRKVSPKDYAPEFHAETYPPGTAPASNSYTPNTRSEVGSQAQNPNVERSHGKESVKTTADQSLQGATSQDVHTGLGHPGGGQTSAELRHDGQKHRKNPGGGLEGVGASQEPRNERQIPGLRGLERDEAKGGQRGDKGALAAEDRQPESAETLDAEWKYEPQTQRQRFQA
ncbi:hypothetical protein RU639_006566 [Aspergillus parasiticus]|uniref:Uncharacterized protein n=4 Tax=Aspergillus subgen. Circumdati TaxID=2720871 RepID=A0A2G7FX74_9EURO|nr:hypothetical protein BDV33DRAFT_135999 [Aspergillus novoparasiticus]KAB8272923.1 hypothetical protein BDV30DRAFT_226923 [Aspergillus minisclerotigenes]KAE8330749.1 hypothetical protein BDV39DRAFT_201767 [Aspergillus sergii]KAE8337368.1 hypothetical protein BDV24DRAFT_140158 [Aspergillus arachidicola]PIG84935.1 hypothetical protein AARAC_005616 [Aspergillus arachidicola]